MVYTLIYGLHTRLWFVHIDRVLSYIHRNTRRGHRPFNGTIGGAHYAEQYPHYPLPHKGIHTVLTKECPLF